MSSWRKLLTLTILATCTTLAQMQISHAAGGCGSVCLPLDALDPERTQLRADTLRVGFNYERARFNNFRESDDDVPNPGGNKAVITQASVFVDYGVNEKFTVSILLPYVKKDQETNRFNKRVAEGVGDISVFGRYEIVSPKAVAGTTAHLKGPSIALGMGLKFPSGDINEPGRGPRLPPAFQTGSGAYDVIPTASYFQDFGSHSLFGSVFARVPLQENHRGYRFGREYELNIGGQYPLPAYRDLSLMLSFSLLHADHDRDSEGIVPARLRDGKEVLNTGGQFIDVVPGLRWQASRKLSAQLRFSIPVHEDWNGRRPGSVGQVAPDVTTMFTLSYRFGLLAQ